MSRETVRLLITAFLLLLLAAVALRRGEGNEVALTLAPISGLLAIALRFYFISVKETRIGNRKRD